jgi:RNA polymerase-interacting CarD/CdnL/TRCF family regulator
VIESTVTERELQLLGLVRDLQRMMRGRHTFIEERSQLTAIEQTLASDFADVQEERDRRTEQAIIALGWRRDGKGWTLAA